MYPAIVIGLIVSGAQDATQYKEALQLIRDTAADICYTIEQKGNKAAPSFPVKLMPSSAVLSRVLRILALRVRVNSKLKNIKAFYEKRLPLH
jgi:hypothetical protein